MRLVNLQRGVSDPHRAVQHRALRRLVHAQSLRPERRLEERNHLVRLAQVQIWLYRAQPLRPWRPSTWLGDVPVIAEGVFDGAPAVA